MNWTDQTRQGFALAAIVANDSGASAAEKGLAKSVSRDVMKLAQELADLESTARKQKIKHILELSYPHLPKEPAISPRALSLLATSVPYEVGRKWLTDAPPPRPGFQPESALKRIIVQIASSSNDTSTAADPAMGDAWDV